jgi:hypothetical protein
MPDPSRILPDICSGIPIDPAFNLGVTMYPACCLGKVYAWEVESRNV